MNIPGCYWWNRWWHHRKRIIDATTVIEAIVDRSKSPSQALAAIKLFWVQPGQEHWWCDCAWHDRESYITVFDRDGEWGDYTVEITEDPK